MANYWRDFSADTAGAFPTGFTPQWHVSTGDLSVVDISADSPPAGFTRAARTAVISAQRGAFTLDAVDSDADRATFKVAALVRITGIPGTVNTTVGAVGGRISGTTTSETGVVSGFSRDGALRLFTYYYNNASSGGTTDDFYDYVADTWYWYVLDVSGTTSNWYLYPENDPGGTPLTSGSTSTVPTGAGGVGFFVFRTEVGAQLEFAALEVATGSSSLNYSDGAPDTTAPTLTSATASATGASTADLSVSTDEGNGTLYWVVSESATPPSVAQIQSGNDSTGSAAAASGNQAVSTTGAQTPTATGLSASTTYYAYFQHSDAAGNDSAVVGSSSFATLSSSSPGISLTLYDNETAQANVTGITWLWWDATDPSGAPAGSGTTESTDGSGVLQVDLSAFTTLSIGQTGFLLLWKADATNDEDSLAFAGRVDVVNIA